MRIRACRPMGAGTSKPQVSDLFRINARRRLEIVGATRAPLRHIQKRAIYLRLCSARSDRGAASERRLWRHR